MEKSIFLTMDVLEVRSPKRRSISYDFSNLARDEAREGNVKDVRDILDSCPADKKEEFLKNLNGFQRLFERFLDDEENKQIQWGNISPPPEDMIKSYETLNKPTTNIKEILDKLVVVKLNGGLYNVMGCTGPRCVITVRNEFTFLDMHVQQVEKLNNKYGCEIPIVLMNSFNNHEETQKVFRKYTHVNVPLYCFKQSQYPQIFKESFRTVPRSMSEEDKESWYPPGHGDFYQSFYNSGLLQKFIDDGKEYLFVSNIDNLGATIDLSILNYLLSQSCEQRSEFVMEVTDKTKADVIGGTLIKYKEKLRLLEISQVPKDYVEDFKAVSKFRIFNTNNLWVQLPAIKNLVESHMLCMEIITNNTQINNGDKIIELSTAIGAAVKCFNHSIGVNVPRSRFLPVKTCSDLLLVMSNLYNMSNGTLLMSSQRQFSTTPFVKLGNYFKKVKEFLKRFDGIPDIIDLDHLTVAGDVTFGRGIVLRGTVIIIANHGERIDIPSGTILENKIVSGNLRIMNH